MQRHIVWRFRAFLEVRAHDYPIVGIKSEVMRIEELVDVGRKGDAVVKRAQLALGEGLYVAGLD